MDPLKKAFIAADVNHVGVVTVRELIKELSNENVQWPSNIMNFFLNTLLIKDNSKFSKNGGLVNQVFDVEQKLCFSKL